MDKILLVNKVNEAVEELKNDKCGTYFWNLDTDNNGNNWAIVLGFDSEDNICVKLAYQPNNSIMQCDYDIDWLTPYDEESGEVDDNELCIEDRVTEEEIGWLLDCYSRYDYLFN